MGRCRSGFPRIIIGLAVLAALFLSAGCHRPAPAIFEQAKLPYKVSGASDAKIIEMQERFNKNGVRVITIGQDYMVAIPSDALFPSESPQIKWGSYGLLNDVACYLQQFRKVSVTVTAFSRKCASPRREHALSLARARAVGDYLWSQDIKSRFIFTQGMGADKPIVSIRRGCDQSFSTRVEITFRRAVA